MFCKWCNSLLACDIIGRGPSNLSSIKCWMVVNWAQHSLNFNQIKSSTRENAFKMQLTCHWPAIIDQGAISKIRTSFQRCRSFQATKFWLFLDRALCNGIYWHFNQIGIFIPEMQIDDHIVANRNIKWWPLYKRQFQKHSLSCIEMFVLSLKWHWQLFSRA